MGKFKQINVLVILSVALLVVQPLGVCAKPASIPSKTADQHTEDEQIIRSQADNYASLFAGGDFEGIANMWTVDGTYTTVIGDVLSGREAIETFFKKSFETYGKESLKISIESIKFLSNNIAIEEGHSRLLFGAEANLMSHYTVVHKKD